MIERVRQEQESLEHGIIIGDAPPGFASLGDLIDKPAGLAASALDKVEIDPETEKKQVARLEKLRAGRDNRAVTEVLERVRQTAETDENVMPVLIEAVKSHATVGEISDALRSVFGDYREPNIL